MAKKYGPSKAELTFRILFSLGGLLFMCGVVAYRGWPPGPAAMEVLIFGTLFFGGTLVWSLRALRRDSVPDDQSDAN